MVVTHKVVLSFGSRSLLPIDAEVDIYETVLFIGTIDECKWYLF